MSIEFAWPWMFACLPLPLLVWRFAPPLPRRTGAIRVPFFELARPAGAATSPSRLALAGLALGYLLLVTAAARPQWPGEADRLVESGRDLVLAVDVSGSMKTADLEVDGEAMDRLSVVKTLGADFLRRRGGDRVALVLFGTHAYLQAPLTFDRDTVSILLDESAIGIAGERTAIGDAIALAIKRLRDADAAHRVLVLMTDGANTAGSVDPREAARLAATAGLTVHTVGIGAERMVVDSVFGTRAVNPSSDLDEALLREVATTTGGQYFRARSSDDLHSIYRLLDQLEPVPRENRDARRATELYPYLLAPLVLAALGGLLATAWPPGMAAMRGGRR